MKNRTKPQRASRLIVVALTVVVGVIVALRPAAPATAAPPAPLFSLPLIAGGHGTLSLQALRGHPVILNFFQSDCGPVQPHESVERGEDDRNGPHEACYR